MNRYYYTQMIGRQMDRRQTSKAKFQIMYIMYSIYPSVSGEACQPLTPRRHIRTFVQSIIQKGVSFCVQKSYVKIPLSFLSCHLWFSRTFCPTLNTISARRLRLISRVISQVSSKNSQLQSHHKKNIRWIPVEGHSAGYLTSTS